MGGDALDAELRRRRRTEGEKLLPPTAAVAVAIAVYAALPGSVLFAPRFVIPALEAMLLVALVVTSRNRLTRESRWSRATSAGLASVVIAANLVSLGLLIATLADNGKHAGGLLVAAMQVWLTNVIGFGLLFWELDRGGPVARRKLRRDRLPPADWRFSQDENADAVVEVAVGASTKSGWIPTFVDYLYLSLTNSSAFSPTDTMPLTSRAKILMGFEATAALMTSLLVISRAVGTLGS